METMYIIQDLGKSGDVGKYAAFPVHVRRDSSGRLYLAATGGAYPCAQELLYVSTQEAALNIVFMRFEDWRYYTQGWSDI